VCTKRNKSDLNATISYKDRLQDRIVIQEHYLILRGK